MFLHMHSSSNLPATRRAVILTALFLPLAGEAAKPRVPGGGVPSTNSRKPTRAAMSPKIEQVCDAYLQAWSAGDLQRLAAQLHADIHFKSPNADSHGREAYLAAVARMKPLLLRLDVHARLHGPDSAMFMYDFVCREPLGTVRTAEWVRFEDGLIRDSEVFFDPRPFEALARAAREAATRG
jgi:hypothetical protein